MYPSPYFLAGLVALLALIFLMNRPDLGMAALVCTAFLIPFEVAVSASVTINPVFPALGVLALLWLLRSAHNKRLLIVSSRPMVPLVLLTGMATVSWIYGNAVWDVTVPKASNLLFIQLAQWTIFALSAVAFILMAQQSIKTLRWTVAAFIVLGTIGLVARYGGPFSGLVSLVLTTAPFSNGTFFVWMAALSAGQALFNQDLGRPWRFALGTLAIAVPILGFWQNTDWASSWLPPLLALLVLALMRFRRAGPLLVLLALLIVILSSGALGQIYDWQTERDVSVAGREVLWDMVVKLGLRQPILGLGLTTYHQYARFTPLFLGSASWYEPNVNAHNVYIDVFAQMGVIGLALLLWALASIGSLGLRLRRQLSGDFRAGYVASALAGLVAMAVASALVDWLIPFVYNVGLSGFRFSIFSWVFFGGLVIIARESPVTER